MGKPTKNCRNVTKEIPHFPGENDETPVRSRIPEKNNPNVKYRTTPGELWNELNEVFQIMYDKYTVEFEKLFQGYEPEGIKAHPLAAHFLSNLGGKKHG